MYPNVKTPSLASPSEDLPLVQPPDAKQLDKVEAHLDLLLLALESLTGIGLEGRLEAAKELNLELPQRSGEHEALEVEAARSLAPIACYLAKQHQELIRRACSLLEQMAEPNPKPHRSALLEDYLDAFCQGYQERRGGGSHSSPELLQPLAFKLLIDLLFYSGANGCCRLWLALLDRSC